MFNQKVLIGTLIVAILNFALSFLWYDVLMSDFFPIVEGATRVPVNFPVIILGVILFSFGFASIFRMAQNPDEPLTGQALKYGFLAALMTSVAYSLFNFGSLNIWNGTQVAVDIIFNVILIILSAVVLARYYGPMPSKGGGLKPGGGNKGGGLKPGGGNKGD